jgi:hypothetical protein
MLMRSSLLLGLCVLVLPMSVSSQVIEHDRVPRGYNKHPLTVGILDGCSLDPDMNPDLDRRQNRIDPIPTYGWVWVTVDAIRNLKWPRAAQWVDRFSWNAILTRAQRDSIRAYEGTPVAVDGFLRLDSRTRTPVFAARQMGKASRDCELTGGTQDWQFWLTGDKNQPRSSGVSVVVTPRMRQAGWDMAKLREIADRGLMVRVWGWLLFDPDYEGKLARRSRGKVQGTLWKVHPIVEIEVFQDKRTLVPLREWDPSDYRHWWRDFLRPE